MRVCQIRVLRKDIRASALALALDGQAYVHMLGQVDAHAHA